MSKTKTGEKTVANDKRQQIGELRSDMRASLVKTKKVKTKRRKRNVTPEPAIRE